MVFEILEKNGDVIKSSPTVDKLEEEQFDNEFYVAYISNENAEDLQKMLMKVSEVKRVEVKEINQTVLNQSPLNESEKADIVTDAAPVVEQQTTTLLLQPNKREILLKQLRMHQVKQFV